jgi:hypothetical protein
LDLDAQRPGGDLSREGGELLRRGCRHHVGRGHVPSPEGVHVGSAHRRGDATTRPDELRDACSVVPAVHEVDEDAYAIREAGSDRLGEVAGRMVDRVGRPERPDERLPVAMDPTPPVAPTMRAVSPGPMPAASTTSSAATPASESAAAASKDTPSGIERAQAEGTLRPDFVPEDLVLLLMANAGVVQGMGTAAPDGPRRFVALLLDGLKSEGATELPPPPSPRQVVRAMRGLRSRGTR